MSIRNMEFEEHIKNLIKKRTNLQKHLLAMGIEKGENIAIWSDNKREWLLSQYATGKMGAVLVTVNTNYQATELEYLLKQSDATTLILDESFKGTSYIDIIRTVCPELVTSERGSISSVKLPPFQTNHPDDGTRRTRYVQMVGIHGAS